MCSRGQMGWTRDNRTRAVWVCIDVNVGMHWDVEPLTKAQRCLGVQHILDEGVGVGSCAQPWTDRVEKGQGHRQGTRAVWACTEIGAWGSRGWVCGYRALSQYHSHEGCRVHGTSSCREGWPGVLGSWVHVWGTVHVGVAREGTSKGLWMRT